VLADGYKTAPAKVFAQTTSGRGTWLKVIMKEGKKRQIRETAAMIGLHVDKLIRVRIGSLELGNLKPGEWRYLRPEEIFKLKELSAINH